MTMKFRFVKCSAVLSAALLALSSGLARAQTPTGAFDQFFGNASAFGWACLPGDSQTKVTVYYGLYDGSSWAYYRSATADKQRNDIGRAGTCGSPSDTESYYHGFEVPVFLLELLQKNRSYGVYAWVYTNTWPYYQFLSGGGSINTWESGLPTSQTWRTDYDDPYLRQPALISCIWPFHGANQRAIPAGNPPTHPFTQNTVGGGATPGGAVLHANGTVTQGGFGSVGFNTPNIYCINYPADTTLPAPWTASNSAAGSTSGYLWPTASSGSPSWPGYNYWVVHANNEMAYVLADQPNGGFWKASSGPPGQSEPVTGGLFSVNADPGGFTLSIDTNAATHKSKLPFLSIGAQMGRGVGGPIAYVDASGLETFVEFDVTRLSVLPAGEYQLIDFFVEGIFGETKRHVWISLGVEQRSVRTNWNWNAAQSFFYPGADLNLFAADEALGCPNMPASALIPNLGNFPVGVTKSVSIPLRAMFKCVDAVPWNSPRSWGQSPLTYGSPLLISGIHLGIETGHGAVGQHSVHVTTPRLVKR
jgi:hypothetical protein